jgi:hypothetical protein
MALGEEEAEVEASVSTKAQSCRRQSCQDRELPPQGPEPEQPPCLEAKRSTVSSEWEAEGLPAPACWPEADPGSASGAYLACAITAREPIVDGYKTAFCGPLPPASMGTRDLLPSAESQVGIKADDTGLAQCYPCIVYASISLPSSQSLCRVESWGSLGMRFLFSGLPGELALGPAGGSLLCCSRVSLETI